MQPRPYQADAMNAVNEWLPANDGNPCVVIPTGGGKTPTMAWLIQQWLQAWPTARVLVLAHIKELLAQGVEKMREIWPTAPIGIYSAGLKARDMHQPVTYAGIQSVHRLACEFDPFDVIMVDEAHRIPTKAEGTYRKFLADTALVNPRRRIVGWTATPYRLDGGPICGPDNILNEIIYEADVADLIDQGYLSKLRSKGADASISTKGLSIRNGDFVTSQLESLVKGKVEAAVEEAVGMLRGRESIMFFCISVDHAYAVSDALRRHGIITPVVHAKTPSDERDATLSAFKAGRVRAIANVNVLSEGFDARRVDAIVMFRPTASGGLYYQQVGRGLRLFEGKRDCLVLDFAGNIIRHGPIDRIRIRDPRDREGEGGEAPVKVCPECKEVIYASMRTCPECDYEFPPPDIKHEVTATNAPVISTPEPWDMPVTQVLASKHQKQGGQPVLRVDYCGSGLERHTEWVCLEHDGYPKQKAVSWWKKRFGDPVPRTVEEAIGSDMMLGWKIQQLTASVRVREKGKYTEVLNVSFKNEHSAIIG